MAISYGLAAGYTAARRVFEDPGLAHQQGLTLNRYGTYQLLWAYYSGEMFEKIASVFNGNLASTWQFSANGWNLYKQQYNLYRNIRLIYNPVRRLVDFYAGQVYPGVLSEDGTKLPDGVPLAVPFAEDTPAELKAAVAQFWTWSNWQARKSAQVRYGAALGNVLLEVIDDVERGQVGADIVWPGFIPELELDNAGNVKRYVLEYLAMDDQFGSYIYRKEVDENSIRYYKDDDPFDYGDGAVVENPYGFTPAVWIKHIDVGGVFGSPASAGSLGKIDELNNLASHAHDQIHKIIGAPSVLWSDGAIGQLFNTPKRGPTSDLPDPTSDQESVLMLKGPAGGHVESLAGQLDLAQTLQYMVNLQNEIEQDHPELTYYKELRSMSQVTGPAASRLVGDVESRFAEAAASYDLGNTRLFQMAVAIGGFRASSGGWGRSLSKAQQKFLPYNLDSWAKGDLDMAIQPRPLMKPTRLEIGQETEQMWRAVYFAVQAGVPAETVLKESGWTDEKIQEMQNLKMQKIQQQEQAIGPIGSLPAPGQTTAAGQPAASRAETIPAQGQ